MSTLSAAPQAPRRLVHAAGFYRSDEELLAICAPFCEEAIEADEPIFAGLEAHKADLLRSALSQPNEISFASYDEHYRHPPGALNALVGLCERLAGPSHVRVLGETPRLTNLGEDAWIRYDAAISHLLHAVPVHVLCIYDTRTTSEAVQREVLRTHDVVIGGAGRPEPNPRYEPPHTFMASRSHEARDPLEHHRPHVELVDPDPPTARRTVAALATQAGLASAMSDDLLVAVNEVVTNAILHGLRPFWVRGWSTEGRVVVAVRDPGPGPLDPFAGLLPRASAAPENGLGLSITQQLCPETALSKAGDCYTVRIAAGSPRR